MAASVVVQKIPYDFASLEVELSVAGGTVPPFGILEGINKVEYTCTINREKFYGTARNPLIRTQGRAEYEASITFHRSWYNYIVGVAKTAGVPLALLTMTMNVSYVDPATNEVVTDTLTGVAIGEIDNKHSDGPDHLMVDVPLDPMNIYFSGMDVYGNMLAA